MEYKISNWFEGLIHYFWINKKIILSDKSYSFEYPLYGNLPKSISSKLTSDQVNIIREELIISLICSKTRKAFANMIIRSLTNDIVTITKI